MEKESFILYNSFYEPIKTLKNEQLGKLFRAIFNYTINGEITKDNDILVAFMFIKNQLDMDNEKWQKEKEKRSEAGKKGMASRWGNKNNITNDNSVINSYNKNNSVINAITKITDNVNDNDNVNENVNDNDNDNNNIIRDSFEKNESKTQNNSEIIREVVNYLNTCGEYEKFEKVIKFRYKYTSNYIRKIITARINEGYNIEDFKDVIFNCYKKFVVNEFIGLNNKSSIQYYNPEVMFTSEKMVKYLNEYDSIR